MSDPNAEREGRRASIFGERKVITIRMSADLNKRLMDLCDHLQVPANTHVASLANSALSKADPLKSLPNMGLNRGGRKVVLTCRFAPDLHERLNNFTTANHLSVNAFLCSLIEKDLQGRGRASSP